MRTEAERTDLFRAEIMKMFLAYNKPIVRQTIDAKAGLMSETLSTLPTGKIQDFFKYVRSTEDALPNDGQLKKILGATYRKFSSYEEPAQIEHQGELPSPEWRREFTIQCARVISGEIEPDEAKQVLGL